MTKTSEPEISEPGKAPARDETTYQLLCRDCKASIGDDRYKTECACGGPLEFSFPLAPAIAPDAPWTGSMWRFHRTLPVRDQRCIVSLREGSTPLQGSVSFPTSNIFLKVECANPTGSHKDRMLSVGISKAREFGFQTVLLYSDGSTGLASAAYAAKAGMRNIVLVPQGVPAQRLLPLAAYGSTLLEFDGGSAEALAWVHDACRTYGLYETSTYRRANPYEAEGAKTISYELFEQLGRVPDWMIIPTGGGGTLAGIWRGFRELVQAGFAVAAPRLLAVVPKGYDLLPEAFRRGYKHDEQLKQLVNAHEPTTLQVKIAMPWPPDGAEALACIRASGGQIIEISDEEALKALCSLASREGIYAEPSAAAAFAAVDYLKRSEKHFDDLLIVTLISGSGFRETQAIAENIPMRRTTIDASGGVTQIEKILCS